MLSMLLSAGAVLSQHSYYDELGRVMEQTGNNGQRVDYSYDSEGRPTAITDALGRTTQMAYDARGRLIKLTDPAGQVTTFGYDALDHVTQIVDPRGLTTRYGYDGFGQLRREDSPDSGTTVYDVNEVGQRIAMTRANGAVTRYSYDGLGRLVQIKAADQVQTLTYDTCTNGIGRLCQATGPNSSVSYRYTPQGEVTERRDTIGNGANARTAQMTYTIDTLGRLSQLRYPRRHPSFE